MLDSQDGGCEMARSLIDSYTSGELGAAERVEVKRHLDACLPCAEAFGGAARLRQLVRQAVRRETAPDSLKRSIRELIREH